MDKVLVYQDAAGEFRWKRIDAGNNETLSESSEGYERKAYALYQATELNPGVEVEVEGGDL